MVHRDDVGLGAARSQLGLNGRNGLENAEHLLGLRVELQVGGGERSASQKLLAQRLTIEGRQAHRAGDGIERLGVGVGVLAHVQAVAVQPEQANLREQRLDDGAHGASGFGLRDRLGDQLHVADQITRVAVGPGHVLGLLGIARGDLTTGGFQPAHDERQFEAERLLGVATAVGLPNGRQELLVAFQGLAQGRRRRCDAVRDAEPLDEVKDDLDVVTHQSVSVAPRGCDGHFRCHEGVAVAVSGHPAAQGHRHFDAQLFTEHLAEGRRAGFVHVVGRREQPVFEVPNHRTDFVHHARAILANLVGEPEQFDVRFELLFELAPLGRDTVIAGQKGVGQARL